MKILIVGTDINSILLAQYIKLQDNSHDIYVTSIKPEHSKFYTQINIQEGDIQSLNDFVKYNQIEFTVVTSQIAIINGIADVFKNEGFPIFAPLSESARITFFNSIAKKIMYKLKINTPRFGIFDRENLATEYIRRSRFPIMIENDFTLLSRDYNIFDTFAKAKLGLQKVFDSGNEKIVIESYIDTNPIYLYFITDGYNALPLITTERTETEKYKIINAPSEKISEKMRIHILQNAIYPLLDDITKYAGNYTGIIGIKIKLTRNNYYILEFYNGFQSYDFQAFLSILNEDLLSLLYDAANGSLADNHALINLTDGYSYTVALNNTEIVSNVDESENDFTESNDDNIKIYTNTAATRTYAKETLLDFIETITNRNTIDEIVASEEQKVIRI
ncbi:hypothetical protein IJ182_03995 [bacterium]|nr:hypothetical protein [bacterium]